MCKNSTQLVLPMYDSLIFCVAGVAEKEEKERIHKEFACVLLHFFRPMLFLHKRSYCR